MHISSDLIIFWVVVVARFIVPLFIPRYPIPAIITALIIDAVDQTVFQQFTRLPLEGYQGYDKALDVYYLVIAYLSTMRNWEHPIAFKISRFLLYWRLVGVTAFELIHWRPLLILFPNTFEYFFIFYEAYRLRWDPRRMSKRFLVGAAAFIWIVIKLPQEWWIHIAQLDTTDFIKQTILGMPVDATLREIFSANPWLIPAILLFLAILLLLLRWGIHRLPPADWPLAFSADAHQPAFTKAQRVQAQGIIVGHVFDWTLFEKIVLISLISIIFAQVLPDMHVGNAALVVGVMLVVVINTALSHWLSRRGHTWTSVLREFIVMAAVNFLIAWLYAFLLPRTDGSLNLVNILFFALLLTVLVTLYDRYRIVYQMRFSSA